MKGVYHDGYIHMYMGTHIYITCGVPVADTYEGHVKKIECFRHGAKLGVIPYTALDAVVDTSDF